MQLSEIINGEMKTVDEENVSSRNSSQLIELHKKVLRQ